MEEILIKEVKNFKTNNTQFDNQAKYVASQIKNHLIEFAKEDEHFKNCLSKDNKDFGECMIFVMNQAFKDPKQSSDDCCYQNARHYYLEDEIKGNYRTLDFSRGSSRRNGNDGNKEMSEAEIKKLKQEAVEEYKKSLEEKANAKAEAKKQRELEKEKKQEESKMSLFDWDD